ncbi:nucleotidyltransferase family protein [Candidatus Bipolaricaulota bacterium]|nr:nucleotidyltransferase family protein [Candidatus Bipolaricaulota bacterium]
MLAAGGGTRMGRPKLLLPVDGRPLLLWVVDLVNRLPLDRRVIVLGAEAEAVRSALFPADGVRPGARFGWTVLVNEGWREGMGSSLRCAAAEGDGGMLVFLGDMPWVPEEAARAVLARAGDRPVAPAHLGRRGFPVFLPPSLRPEVRALAGDRGARDLLRDCDLIAWPDDRVIRDVDRVEDLLHA